MEKVDQKIVQVYSMSFWASFNCKSFADFKPFWGFLGHFVNINIRIMYFFSERWHYKLFHMSSHDLQMSWTEVVYFLEVFGSWWKFLEVNNENYNMYNPFKVKKQVFLFLIVQFPYGIIDFRSLWFLIIRTQLVSNKKQLPSGQVINQFFIKGQINSENWLIPSGSKKYAKLLS